MSSKKDKLLQQLKSGKLTQSGGAGAIASTDTFTGTVTVPTSKTSAPNTTLTTFQNLIDWVGYTYNKADSVTNKANNLILALGGTTSFNAFQEYVKSDNITIVGNGLPAYIDDRITAARS